jgi:hypothetical protein
MLAKISYKWIALSNTTLGVLMASLNATSLIIALPVIFRGIHINPLSPESFIYLLWIMLGYLAGNQLSFRRVFRV